MPKRELRTPAQVIGWLAAWGRALKRPSELILIGSAGLLWHARGRDVSLPEDAISMDADVVTESEAVAALGYEAMIGSEFELRHGWHVNLMPRTALDGFPKGWRRRARREKYGRLTVVVPAVADLLQPKLARDEPRDRSHAAWARRYLGYEG